MNRLSFFLVAGGQYFLHSWRSFILHGLLGKAKHSQISHGYNVTFDFGMNWHFIFFTFATVVSHSSGVCTVWKDGYRQWGTKNILYYQLLTSWMCVYCHRKRCGKWNRCVQFKFLTCPFCSFRANILWKRMNQTPSIYAIKKGFKPWFEHHV